MPGQRNNTIGEQLILPHTKEALHTLVHHPFPSGIIKQFHLVIIMESRINEMAENTEEILYNILKNQQFVLQLDESTLPGNEALL